MAETKRCPYCGEEILATAKKCKHCKEWLEQVPGDALEKDFLPTRSTPNASKTNYWLYAVLALVAVVFVAVAVSLHGNSSTKSDDNFSDAWQNLVKVTDSISQETVEDTEDPEIAVVRNLLSNANYTRYSNVRFAFTIDYPDCFVMGEEPQNGDGCGFSLKYGISFSVWGSYNDSDYYGETIQEYFQKDADRAKSTYHVQKNNWFVMSGNLDDGNIFYKKVVLMDDNTDRGTYVTFYLLFPKKFNNVLAEFINHVAKNFNPVFEGADTQQAKNENYIDPLKSLQIEVQSQPKHDEIKNGYTRDQQMALLLLMLAAADDSESGTGSGREMEYPCRSCGLTFTNSADLRSHENAVHDY